MATLSDEQKEFLLQGTRTGKIATVRKDGHPHVVPIWFVLDGDTLIFTTGSTSVKAASMRRDPRVTICVDDESEALELWATRIGGRYMGSELAERYGKRNSTPGELLVRVTPTRIIFETNIAS